MKNLIRAKNNWILKTFIEHPISLLVGLILVSMTVFIPFEVVMVILVLLFYIIWGSVSVSYFNNDNPIEFGFLTSFIIILIISGFTWNYFDYKPVNSVVEEYKNIKYVWDKNEHGISYKFYNPETREIMFAKNIKNPNLIKKESYNIKKLNYNYQWSQITRTKYVIEGLE